MTIAERMARKEPQDLIEIGMVAERATQGDAGHLLRCLIEGIKEEAILLGDQKSEISPDRTLGKITGLTALQERLDQCVQIKNQLLEEKKESKKVESSDVPQDN